MSDSSLPDPNFPDPNVIAHPWATRLEQRDPQLHIHLLGIGGAGMSPIAHVLLDMGIRVSGSDRQPNAKTERLVERGAMVAPQQAAENLLGLPVDQRPDVVLISSAIHRENPERQAAERLGIPVVKRLDFLPALLAGRRVIAVAGTAGKSTTTAMLVHILTHAGLAPGYIIGADLPGIGNAAAGTSPYFVVEADEYDHMFLGLHPTVAVITNVEWDHPDCYPTPASFRHAFMQFVDNVDRRGLMITCRDDAGAEQLRAYGFSRGPDWITYGLDPAADLQAVNLAPVAGSGSHAELLHWGLPACTLTLEVPGHHNVRNALAAIAAAVWCEVDITDACNALSSYRGADRRFQQIGEINDIVVIDDYAHHPTKIRATLGAARDRFPTRRIWAVFQPHTFSRTRLLLHEMAHSFSDADQVLVTNIFAAREQDDGSVSAEAVVAASPHPAIRYSGGLVESAESLAEAVQPGDVVIILGAGDSYRIGELLLAQLHDRQLARKPESKEQ
ncbi:MAG: UDP-N-acetylmuramate--L-alanine ligase [Caldilineaceae bacterium]|nr:UDP-N-acetylmuramate--L-alanine ligase [Caldilineaceae bacterium]